MKKTIVSLAILLIIPSLCSLYISYIENKCLEIKTIIENTNIKNEDAKEYFEKAEKEWIVLKKTLSISTNHSVIEKVNEAFVRTKSAIVTENNDIGKAELEHLSSLIAEVYQMEIPNLYNVF